MSFSLCYLPPVLSILVTMSSVSWCVAISATFWSKRMEKKRRTVIQVTPKVQKLAREREKEREIGRKGRREEIIKEGRDE